MAQQQQLPQNTVKTPNQITFPTLYALSTTGKVKQWQISVTHCKDNTAKIRTEYGYADGKRPVTLKAILGGKNIGKKNETTPFQQATKEALSKWTDKISSEGFREELEERATISAISSTAPTTSTKQEQSISSTTTTTPQANFTPMLAQDYRKHAKKITFPCYVQPKLDGVRCVYYRGNLYSRTNKAFSFMERITGQIQAVLASEQKELILDGELYSHDVNFQDMVGIVHKKTLTPADEKLLEKLELWVFDMISDEPYTARKQTLEALFAKNGTRMPNIRLVQTDTCPAAINLPEMHEKYTAQRYEGIMLRNTAAPYKLGQRSYDLQKYKTFFDEEYTITSYTQGTGIEEGLVLWICETPDKKQFTVRPAGSHEMRTDFYKNAAKYIGKKLTVKYQELTKDGIPRFPVGIAIRDYD